MFVNLREPRRKNFKQKEILLPLPIPCRNQNKNIENCSKLLPNTYTAVLEEKHILVKNEWQAKCLYNCGFFGKGEYSKGIPSLNENNIKRVNESDDPDEYSINSKNITNIISNERFTNKLNWQNIKKYNSLKLDDFNSKFLNEFVSKKLSDIPNTENKYIKVYHNDLIELDSTNSVNMDKLYKSNNNPFMFKIKKSPNVLLNEYLSLMHEEAFYLTFALGCLDVHDEQDTKLDLNELWKLLFKHDNRFPFKYAAYHKLRSKGWILKNGIKYGCDFMAYYEGPEHYHASYGVIVRNISIKDNESLDEFVKLSALIRINETVSKEVLLCYVIDNKLNNDLSSLECLKHFKLNELLINRWVPGNDLAKSLATTNMPLSSDIPNSNVPFDDDD